MTEEFCSCGFRNDPDVDHGNQALNSVIVKLETARTKALDGEPNYFDHIDLNNVLHKLYHAKVGFIEARHYKVMIKKFIDAYLVGGKIGNAQQNIIKTNVGGEKTYNGREHKET